MTHKPSLVLASLLLVMLSPVLVAAGGGSSEVSIRTEQYPRPPYSGATYFIYERNGETICTRLEVCNKFDECSISYHRGSYRDTEDQETGEPYGTSPARAVAASGERNHACLLRYDADGT